MHFFYILHSNELNRFYIGESEHPTIRLKQHNDHYFKTNFTKAANDWRLILTFECKNKDEALYIERFVKQMKSKKFIEKVMLKPDILKDILSKR